jgi:hypothetical protein
MPRLFAIFVTLITKLPHRSPQSAVVIFVSRKPPALARRGAKSGGAALDLTA